MPYSSLLTIHPPFDVLAAEERWQEYATAFCERGIRWWFDMDIPRIAAHLGPLMDRPSLPREPARLRFLRASVGPVLRTEEVDGLYREFLKENDLEGAAAAAGAGTASIWDSGERFDRFPGWTARIGKLLRRPQGLPAVARSSLLVFRGLAELMGRADLSRAEATWADLAGWAEEADSPSLKVYAAAARTYPLIWSGRIAQAQILLADAAPLAALPDTSLVCSACFRIALGSCHIALGNAAEGRRVLEETVEHPLFGVLPPSIWLLGQSHFLMAAAFEGDEAAAEAASERIHAQAVSEGNHFHHGYSHFNLGIAAVQLGRPHRALLHARESAERGSRSGSPIPETVSSLVLGQALADLKRDSEALEHLEGWVGKWKAAGFGLFASAGALEMAALLARNGKTDQARRSFERAESLLPPGEPPPGLFRPPEFVAGIRRALYPAAGGAEIPSDPDALPVFLETFGGLKVRVGKRILYDRQWRGKSTKTLLKALVAFGGMKVSADLLADIIWPELDGDSAKDNLKVALSRLRRLGRSPDEAPLSWILVRHGKVSLARSLCAADAILFEEGIRAAKNGGDGAIDLLRFALSLYKEEFLVHDVSEEWIVRHRERLREEFLRGAIAFSEMCIAAGRHDESLPFLRKAIEKDPLHEAAYAALMRLHLATGYPSEALRLYRQARETLKQELGVEPGSVLQALSRKARGAE